MKDGTYHSNINLPCVLIRPFTGLWRVAYGNHARAQAAEDRNGVIKLPSFVTVLPGNVIEVQVADGVPVKAVVRVDYDASCDLVLVLNHDEYRGEGMFARTVWLNRKDDNHRTLRRELYVK